MTQTLINQNNTIREEFLRLLELKRTLDKRHSSRQCLCTRCGRPESQHYYSERYCQTYVTSPTFVCLETDQLTQIDKAICLIEELKNIEIQAIR